MLTINGLYRHFKGGYYVINQIALMESNPNKSDPMVVYTSVDTGNTWIRPYSEVIADVSNREDNVTGQKHRLERATNVSGILSHISTNEIIQELENRPDNPYDGIKPLKEDPDVWAVQYLVGRLQEKTEPKTQETYTEFVPVTLTAWSSYEEALRYRDRYFPHRNCTIARRVTRKIKEF